jgi:dihydroorotase
LIADSVLINAKAYFKQEIVDCSIAINEGKILKIGKEVNMPKADVRTDLKGQLVLPGLIDVHVHLRDEGKSRKEDFYSGTAAAAAGGFTTVIDMPNNEPVTMSPRTLHDRMEIAERKVLVNVGFRSEFPNNLKNIEPIVKEGALGFKLFMAEQIGGLDLGSDEAITDAFKRVAKLGVSVAVHAEDRDTLKHAEDAFKKERRNDIAAFLKAHSEIVELKAVERVLNIVRNSGVQLHFCHVTTKEGLEAIVEGKKSGLTVSCETTPHNLLLSSDNLRRIGMLCLTMPPVRDKPNIEALWDGLQRGSIDMVASDHAPHMLKEKEAESVWDVKVGIPGLETTLPLMLTEVNRGRLTIGDVVRLMAEKPAELFKLKGKGLLKEGNDADLTVVDLYRKHKIDSSRFLSKAKYSPFDGREVEGKPMQTYINGQLTMDAGEITAKPGTGTIIRREKAV